MSQQSDHDILIRVDTTVSKMDRRMDLFEETFVTKEAFQPVQRIAYGLVALICVSVGGAVLASTVGAKTNETRPVVTAKP